MGLGLLETDMYWKFKDMLGMICFLFRCCESGTECLIKGEQTFLTNTDQVILQQSHQRAKKDQVNKIINKYKRIKMKEDARVWDILIGTVKSIIHYILGHHKVSAWWPHCNWSFISEWSKWVWCNVNQMTFSLSLFLIMASIFTWPKWYNINRIIQKKTAKLD